MNTDVLIKVEKLRKAFGPIVAVNGVSFSARKGDVLGFIGPNGAGKTTTLRMLSCFLPPDGGRAEVNGYDVGEQTLEVRRSIGYLSEKSPLYGEMTVESFLDFICHVRGCRSEKRSDEISRVVYLCELKEVGRQKIDTLSKGYQRRVGLAQALVGNPPVLILDEPMAGLDPIQKQVMRTLITQMSKQKCIIFSTHVLEEMETLCNRAVMIHKGKIVVDSTPADLKERGHGKIDVFFRESTKEEE